MKIKFLYFIINFVFFMCLVDFNLYFYKLSLVYIIIFFKDLYTYYFIKII
jgi:hypothetical protein